MANFCLFMPFSQKILETTGVLLYDINTSTLWTVCFPQSRMIQGVSRKGRDTMSSIDSVSATQSSAVYSSQNTSVKNNTAAVESASSANASAGSKADSSNGVTLEVSSEAKAAAAARILLPLRSMQILMLWLSFRQMPSRGPHSSRASLSSLSESRQRHSAMPTIFGLF